MTNQFPGATKMVLSPAAQAIEDAVDNAWSNSRAQAAAALRAVADQVAPSDAMEPRNYIPMALECQRIRAEILTIADELEGNVLNAKSY
jgi:hypothetical protein